MPLKINEDYDIKIIEGRYRILEKILYQWWELERPESCVYFLKTLSAPFVKIGFTTGDPRHRIRSLQTGCPYHLYLKFLTAGNRGLEHHVQAKFQSVSLSSEEWFFYDDKMKRFLNKRIGRLRKQLEI